MARASASDPGRRGHQYLTVVYDLERRALLWVGRDRTEQTLARFFTSLGARRCRTVQAVCLDMWAAYAKAVRTHLPHARILFEADRVAPAFRLISYENSIFSPGSFFDENMLCSGGPNRWRAQRIGRPPAGTAPGGRMSFHAGRLRR
ncbi:MAG: transposase [Acidobacteria bacterium]|nr:transposase [Acidobacteriota bacterium]